MFFSISMCNSEPQKDSLKTGNIVAAGADVLLGLAILTLGILSTQMGFLPHNVGYALIGSGATYTFGMLCGVGFIVNLIKNERNAEAKAD